MRTTNVSSFFRNTLSDQGGQVLPWVTLMMVSLIGMAGLTIDVGQAYVMKAKLQSSSSAAAIASAQNVYNTGANDSAPAVAGLYTSDSGSLNAISGMGTITPNVTTPCLNALTSTGSGCTNNAAGNAVSPSLPNAVRVTQTATVPTTFMRFFGINSLTVKSTATAAFGTAKPWNVVIIVDGTPSMGNNDSYCGNITAEQCALNGIQTLLGGGDSGGGIPPCKDGFTTCPSKGANALFRVALFTFPNVTSATVGNDYGANCSSTKPTEVGYSLVQNKPIPTGYKPLTYAGTEATYQVTPSKQGGGDDNGFYSDYYDASTSDHLNHSSLLVTAIGYAGHNGCLKPPTGFSNTNQTYFASAIYAAQAALNAEKPIADALTGLDSSNAIIFVSDGQANSAYIRFPQATSTATPAGYGYSVTSAGSSTKNLTGTAGTFGKYPDYNNDCQQSIQAAQDVKALGTRFYAVAYGSEAGGCLTTKAANGDYGTDSATTLASISGTLNVSITSPTQIVPCLVMENMASPGATSKDPWYFYTDGSSSANGCKDTSHTSTNIDSIFGAISATFVKPRLVPNNLT